MAIFWELFGVITLHNGVRHGSLQWNITENLTSIFIFQRSWLYFILTFELATVHCFLSEHFHFKYGPACFSLIPPYHFSRSVIFSSNSIPFTEFPFSHAWQLETDYFLMEIPCLLLTLKTATRNYGWKC